MDSPTETAAAREHDAGEAALRPDTARRLATFARIFVRSTPVRAQATAALLIIGAGLTEGIGLALLAPLIALIGSSGKPAGAIGEITTRALESVGLPVSLATLIVIFVALVTCRTIIVWRRDVALADLRSHFVEALRGRLFDAILRAEWSLVAKQRLANLNKALTIDAETIGHGTYFFLQFPTLTLLGLVQLAVAFSLAPLITAVVVVCGGLLGALVWHRRGDAYRMGRQFAHAQRAAVEEMSDCLAALKLAKSHNAEDRHRRRFAEAVARQRDYLLTFSRRNAEARMLFGLGATLALGTFVYIGAVLAGLATPELLVLIVIFARLMPLFGELQQSVQVVAHMLPVFDDLIALLARCEAARESIASGGSDRLPLRQEIRFDDVRFRYDAGADSDLLDGLDLVVPAGTVFAISGASGAGKSTLADMMMGLLVPDCGAVSVDGAPLTGVRLAAWRRSVAYVPQENFLFNQSLRANLQWAAPEASEEELRNALSLTGADPLLAAMPAGLDTVIGERGNRLSGGERQRIAISRALLRHPTLLVLDEATSALDDESEAAMWTVINRLRGTTTIVIIAHRSSALRQADLVAVLEKGRIVRSGPWRVAMEEGGAHVTSTPGSDVA